jgi:hypothetical protein
VILLKNPNNLIKNFPLYNLIKLEVILNNLIDLNTLKDLNIIVVNIIDYLIDNAKEDKEEYNKDIVLKLQI